MLFSRLDIETVGWGTKWAVLIFAVVPWSQTYRSDLITKNDVIIEMKLNFSRSSALNPAICFNCQFQVVNVFVEQGWSENGEDAGAEIGELGGYWNLESFRLLRHVL